MLFLVDGYNVTRSDEATRRLHPDDARLALVRRLAARGRGLLGPGRTVVVFDKGRLADEPDLPGVEVVFSRDVTADDVIVRLAEAEAGPVTVVTSDRELQARVREHAGRSSVVLPASALWESAPASNAKRRAPRRHPQGGLPAGHDVITAELGSIWLDGRED
ncbi:MAG TPA: NYN domain-containing protein [Coriobacteriia bacterium]